MNTTLQVQVFSNLECCLKIASCEGDAEKFCGLLTKLLLSLSPRSPPASKGTLESFFLHGGHLVLALDKDENIVGMGTIIFSYRVNDMTARAEDVVVRESSRGAGVGRRIMDTVVELALNHQVRRIDLTSGAGRFAANKLCEELGFTKLDSNVRRLVLRT